MSDRLPLDIYSKIKELISCFKPISITGPINISFFRSIELFTYKKEEKILKANFDLSKIDSKVDRERITQIVELYLNEGYLFIEKDAEQIIEEIEESSKGHKEILKFFRSKLSDTDYRILRLSAYIKSQFDQRKSIDGLIDQLRRRYGDRGSNISHLYSSGYFETHFRPLYQVLEQSKDFKPEQFQKIFDDQIRDVSFAIFVSRHMRNDELEKRIRDKIETNRKYGIKVLKVHGIGKENVEKIKLTLKKFENEKEIRTDYLERNSIIDVTFDLE